MHTHTYTGAADSSNSNDLCGEKRQLIIVRTDLLAALKLINGPDLARL